MSTKFLTHRLLPLVAILGIAFGVTIVPETAAYATSGDISVTTTADSSYCPNGPGEPGFSLRCAINYANATTGTNTIIFRISTSPATLVLRSALPPVTAANTAIDGDFLNTEGSTANTQTLAQGDNATIDVTIDGANVSGADGFVLEGNDDAVDNLRIEGFKANQGSGGYAVLLQGPASGGASVDSQVQGNFIGNVDGNGIANTYGVGVSTTAIDAIVGGASPSQANVIDDNVTSAVELVNASDATVYNNLIGLGTGGSLLYPNGAGIQVIGGTGNVIGKPGDGNVIGGNTGWGIDVTTYYGFAPLASTGGTIQDNIIGLTSNQLATAPNYYGGIELSNAENYLIGGSTAGRRQHHLCERR